MIYRDYRHYYKCFLPETLIEGNLNIHNFLRRSYTITLDRCTYLNTWLYKLEQTQQSAGL